MKHMQKYFWQLFLCAIGIALVWFFFEPAATPPVASTPLNATYRIEGRLVTLENGRAELPAAPGSATTVRTQVFGEPVTGDLNNDGQPDAAFLLIQEPGGTGTFFYLVAALKTSTGYVGTNALFVGDRIAPQNVSIVKGQVLLNYADRAPGEPFSVKPSIGKSLYGAIQDGALVRSTPEGI